MNGGAEREEAQKTEDGEGDGERVREETERVSDVH